MMNIAAKTPDNTNRAVRTYAQTDLLQIVSFRLDAEEFGLEI